MKKAVVWGILAALLAGRAEAGCYNAAQFEAEQGLRIHSELRVIALTCMKAPNGGEKLYNKYVQYTIKNKSLIQQYERDLLAYYKTDETLQNLTTGLSNEISQHAIHMSTASFCGRFGGRIDQALGMDQPKLRAWAQHVWPQQPTRQPVCGK